MFLCKKVHQAVAELAQTFGDIALPGHGQRAERGFPSSEAPFFREILAGLESGQWLLVPQSSRLSENGTSLLQVGHEQLPAEQVRSTMVALDWLRLRDSLEPTEPSAVRALFDLAHEDKPVDLRFFDRLTEVGLGRIESRVAWDTPYSGQFGLPKLDRTFVPSEHVLSVVRAGTRIDDNQQVVLVNPESGLGGLKEWVNYQISPFIQSCAEDRSGETVRGVPVNDFLDIYHRVELLMGCFYQEGPLGISTVEHLYMAHVDRVRSERDPSALQDWEKRLAAAYGLGTVEGEQDGEELTFTPRKYLADVLKMAISYQGQGWEPVLLPPDDLSELM
jgi:hypothetical protein